MNLVQVGGHGHASRGGVRLSGMCQGSGVLLKDKWKNKDSLVEWLLLMCYGVQVLAWKVRKGIVCCVVILILRCQYCQWCACCAVWLGLACRCQCNYIAYDVRRDRDSMNQDEPHLLRYPITQKTLTSPLLINLCNYVAPIPDHELEGHLSQRLFINNNIGTSFTSRVVECLSSNSNTSNSQLGAFLSAAEVPALAKLIIRG